MASRKHIVGLVQYYTDHKVSAGIRGLYKKVEETIVAACPNLTILQFTPDDNNKLSDAEVDQLRSTEIIICDPRVFKGSVDLLPSLTNVKWMHCLFAGVDVITRQLCSQVPPSFVLTRNGSFFDGQMAEYVLGMIIAREKHFIQLRQNQANNLWRQELPCRPLSELSLGIVGFGGIGRRVADVAKAFDMEVLGLVRENKTSEQNGSSDAEYRVTSSLPELLSSCDYICSILPSAPSTDGFFDGGVLSHCKSKKPVFMNIGRGNVVHESSIIEALDQGWISHAILDVFEPEPLPSSSPLWARPDVTITPHQAAIEFDPMLFARNFAKNYQHFVNNEPMEFLVDWKKGY